MELLVLVCCGVYVSPNVIRVIKSRRMRLAENVAGMRGMRNVYKMLVRKSERKRPLRRCRCRWEDIRMVLREIWWEGVDWLHLAEDRDQ
jgi:hypothetical protein